MFTFPVFRKRSKSDNIFPNKKFAEMDVEFFSYFYQNYTILAFIIIIIIFSIPISNVAKYHFYDRYVNQSTKSWCKYPGVHNPQDPILNCFRSRSEQGTI